jgi:hypothetical protein
MGDRHVSVTINASPEVVFGLYTDAGRARLKMLAEEQPDE